MDEAQFLEELKQDFFNEAQTLIESLESNILVLENDPANEDAINEIFRAAHTLKGGSSTLDLDRIAGFTHEMENLLDEVRSGNVKLNPDLVDILLKSIDIVKNLIQASQEGREVEQGYETQCINAIKEASKGNIPGSNSVESPAQAQSNTEAVQSSSESSKSNLELVLNEYDRYAIKKALSEGENVFEVHVHFDNDNPMKTVSGIQIHAQLKDATEILKTVPDIDDLMGDQFFEQVAFLVETSYNKDEVYNKVFLSDVTKKVEVIPVSEEPEQEDSPKESGLTLEAGDAKNIEEHLNAGERVFKIIVNFDEENPMRSVSGILFFTMLKTKGDILKSSPTYEEFKGDVFYPVGEFIISTLNDTQELKKKLFLSDITTDLKFQEFKRDPNQSAAPASSVAEKQEAPETESIETVQAAAPKVEAASVQTESAQDINQAIADKTAAVEAAEQNKDSQQGIKKAQTSVIRVDSSRIDDMLNLVGELVIIKASFFQLNDRSSLILDEYVNSLNQFKTYVRQVSGEIEQYFETQTGENSDGFDGETTVKVMDPEKMKDFVKDKMTELLSYFDEFLPEYKMVQEKLKGSSQSLGRITDDLQESVMKVRMVPINQIFSRFPRLIRDISRNLKKKINLHMEGEDTELDKSVIEDLVDPLIHIVRNAVDHGVETPEERIATGKEEAGNVTLRAEHEGNTVAITIIDDGKGIDVNKVKDKAIKKKLIEPNQELTKKEIVNLIFQAGFSTADEVTSLSGRGVGMDVVRQKIEKLGGVVEIDTELNKGSTFSIKIPLTLAIIQALLVQVSDYIYSIPINSVIETLRIGPEDIEVIENTEVIRVREEVLSLVQVNQLFKHRAGEREEDYFYVIVVGSGDKKIGLGVDNLVGEQDVVIKPLNNKYTNVPGIAGATILGDGQVSLVVDVTGLFSLISAQKKHLVSM